LRLKSLNWFFLEITIMAADESAMDVDVDRPSPHLNGSPRRIGIDFVTMGMFIIGKSHSPSLLPCS
jgi:hypothetical protein